MEFSFSHNMNAKRGEKSNLKQMENIKNMLHIFGGYKWRQEVNILGILI